MADIKSNDFATPLIRQQDAQYLPQLVDKLLKQQALLAQVVVDLQAINAELASLDARLSALEP